MYEMLVVALFFGVAMSQMEDGSSSNLVGRVYQKPNCNGVAHEINKEGDPDLSIYTNPEFENWLSADFRGM